MTKDCAIFVVILGLILADLAAYHYSPKPCRYESLSFLLPFVGGWISYNRCIGRSDGFAE